MDNNIYLNELPIAAIPEGLHLNALKHSCQMYWEDSGYALEDTLRRMDEHGMLDPVFGAQVTALSNSTFHLSDLYGEVLREHLPGRPYTGPIYNEYLNSEIVFYNQLDLLLQNHEFYYALRQNLQYWLDHVFCRFFNAFLDRVHLEPN